MERPHKFNFLRFDEYFSNFNKHTTPRKDDDEETFYEKKYFNIYHVFYLILPSHPTPNLLRRTFPRFLLRFLFALRT